MDLAMRRTRQHNKKTRREEKEGSVCKVHPQKERTASPHPQLTAHCASCTAPWLSSSTHRRAPQPRLRPGHGVTVDRDSHAKSDANPYLNGLHHEANNIRICLERGRNGSKKHEGGAGIKERNNCVVPAATKGAHL